MSRTSRSNIRNTTNRNKKALNEANERAKKWYRDNKEKKRAYNKEWVKKNVEKNRAYQKKFRLKLKIETIKHYGSTCVCCGENNIEFLSIDHIDGNGAQHRRKINIRGGHNFYGWLKKDNYPAGYRTLCMNCNTSLGSYNYCPHKSL